jgi:hypothetical protein
VLGIKNGIWPSGTIPNGYQNGTVPYNSGKWSGATPTYGVAGKGASWNPGPVNTNGVTYPQPVIPATPSAPVGTPHLGSISVDGGTLIFDKTAAAPSGSISSVKSGKTLRIPPGDYLINTLSVTNGGSIQIDSTTQTAIANGDAPPVSLFVSGTNNGAVVVNVDNKSNINMNGISSPTNNGFNTNGNLGSELKNSSGQSVLADNQIAINPPGSSTNIVETSGSAAQLQLYYNGSSYNKSTSSFNTQIVLQGNERMTVYSPNTGILIGSSKVDPSSGPNVISNDANYYGAIVGGSLGINSNYSSGGGVYVHYDQTLALPGRSLGKQEDRNYAISRNDLNPIARINPWAPESPIVYQATHTAYRAISWQETDSNGRFPGQQ